MQLSMQLSQQLVDTMALLESSGLNTGRSGNASVRSGEQTFLITPSGVHPRDLQPEMMVSLARDCEEDDFAGPHHARPSSEWRMHRDIFRAYPDIQAIVHTHSPQATALACTGRSIPAFHYMVAVAGGDSIECAPYATFGSVALSQFAVEALDGRRACLLANHGMLACGESLIAAADLALEVEQLAQQYALSLAIGEPRILSTEQMSDVLEKFKSYGQRTG